MDQTPFRARPSAFRPLCIAILALSLLTPDSGSAQAGLAGILSDGKEDGIDAVFSSLDNTRSPGCAVGVLVGDALVFARGYGMANLDLGIAITPSTVFRTGSVSKQFTAAVVVMLAQEGLFSLDDDVRKFFPELPAYESPITIRQLLHHTSGIRDYLELMAMRGVGDEAIYSEEDVVALLARQESLNFPPGSDFLYSNSGYLLLSRLVERASGNTLREQAERLIFGPLGMETTHFHDNHREIVPQRATGYGSDPESGFHEDRTTLDIVGDGGVFTSIRELALWMRNFWTLVVGGQEWLATLETRGVLNDGRSLTYAMGLGHGIQRGFSFVGHGGAFVGYRAATLRYPDQGTAVMVLCNYGQTNPMGLAQKVGEIILADSMDPPEATPSPEVGPGGGEEPVAEPLDPKEARALVGSYWSEEVESTIRITRSGETLAADVNRAWEFPLIRQADGSFNAGYLSLTFEWEGGEVKGFRAGSRRAAGVLFLRVESPAPNF